MSLNQPRQSMLTSSPSDTKNFAKKIAAAKNTHFPLCLYGDLGTGKTVFAKGVANALGIDENKIKSPTFAFVREYDLGGKKFSHWDLYRINELDDILAQQLLESIEKGPTVIEWAEAAKDILPEKRTDIFFKYIDKEKRQIVIVQNG